MANHSIFAELGLPEAEELLARAAYAVSIRRMVAQRGWTPAQAAQTAGLPVADMRAICDSEPSTCESTVLQAALLRLHADNR